MATIRFVLSFLAVIVLTHGKELPDYIHTCQRASPDISKCIIDSVEDLRPLLAKGEPEFNIPSIEPLEINEIVVAGSTNSLFKVSATNIKAYGCSNFVINRLESDIDNYVFSFGLDLPILNIDAQYDVDGRILLIPIKGNGPMKLNITDCKAEIILKGEIVPEDGNNYVVFRSMDITFIVGKGSVRLENLFGGEKTLGEAINAAINNNFGGFLTELQPSIEKELSSTMLDISNNIVKGFTIDQLLP